MKKLPIDQVRHGGPEASSLVEATLGLVREKVRNAWRESDQDWNAFAMSGNESAIDGAAMADIEQRLLASGHRFDWSAAVSVDERPEIYKPKNVGEGAAEDFMFDHPDAPSEDSDNEGKALRGVGDNVVRHSSDIEGTARYIRSNEKVMQYITEGVPEGTIAIIDDSGGTLTAPIIDQFAGVVCAGGTVRSHLGILTREYNIPCLMNAKVTGIRDGQRVRIECSAAARTTEDYQQKIDRTARVWLLAGEGA